MKCLVLCSGRRIKYHQVTEKWPNNFVGACSNATTGSPDAELSCRAACGVYRRSRALAHLPGPKYPWLLGDMRFLGRLDMHRAATELAERFGPLVRIRVMCFHVRTHASSRGAHSIPSIVRINHSAMVQLPNGPARFVRELGFCRRSYHRSTLKGSGNIIGLVLAIDFACPQANTQLCYSRTLQHCLSGMKSSPLQKSYYVS